MTTDTKPVLLACPRCTTANRVPAARLGEAAKCGKCGAPLLDGHPARLDDTSFDGFLKRTELPVLVDFWADWCGPCHAMAPAFEQASQDLRTQVRFAKLNTEEARSIAARFEIRSIPTMILFQGGRETARISGAMNAARITQWLRQSGVLA
jgi:thioredoxin 2